MLNLLIHGHALFRVHFFTESTSNYESSCKTHAKILIIFFDRRLIFSLVSKSCIMDHYIPDLGPGTSQIHGRSSCIELQHPPLAFPLQISPPKSTPLQHLHHSYRNKLSETEPHTPNNNITLKSLHQISHRLNMLELWKG
jgi:hypothetical protein